MNCTAAVGVDIAKTVFQAHYIDQETGEIVNKAIKRAAFLEHFANRAPCLIGMEACGSAQHWARQLMAMGHQVKLMPAQFVKAFNVRNKNDAADAERPSSRRVDRAGALRIGHDAPRERNTDQLLERLVIQRIDHVDRVRAAASSFVPSGVKLKCHHRWPTGTSARCA
jgi:transposase